jgi:hypothetical protein
MHNINFDDGIQEVVTTGKLHQMPDVAEFNGDQECIMYAMVGDELLSKKYGKIYITEEQDLFVRVALCDLNSVKYNHGGRWRCGVTGAVKNKWDTYSRMFRPYMPAVFRFIWEDTTDQDLQMFTVTIEDDISDILNTDTGGFKHYYDQCDEAWNMMRALQKEGVLPSFAPQSNNLSNNLSSAKL